MVNCCRGDFQKNVFPFNNVYNLIVDCLLIKSINVKGRIKLKLSKSLRLCFILIFSPIHLLQSYALQFISVFMKSSVAQLTSTFSRSPIETPEKGVKYVQS